MDQDRCVRRSEVFVKIQKKYGGGSGGHGSGRCEQRSEVFCENSKTIFFLILFFFLGGGGGGSCRGRCVRGGGGSQVDVNKELKFL